MVKDILCIKSQLPRMWVVTYSKGGHKFSRHLKYILPRTQSWQVSKLNVVALEEGICNLLNITVPS
jgi:hypothetical protein